MALVTMTHGATDPLGAEFEGLEAVIRLVADVDHPNAFGHVNGHSVAGRNLHRVKIRDGALTFQAEPNDNISPTGTYYTLAYVLPDGRTTKPLSFTAPIGGGEVNDNLVVPPSDLSTPIATSPFGLSLLVLDDAAALRSVAALGDAATLDVGSAAGTVAGGGDARFGFGELLGEATSEQQVSSSAAVSAPTLVPGLGLTVDHDGDADLIISYGGVLSSSVVSSIPTLVLLRNGVPTNYSYGGTVPAAGWFIKVHDERSPLLAPATYSWTVGLANAGAAGSVTSFNAAQTGSYLRVVRV